MKFKVGDKVKLDISNNSKRTDFLADLQMNLADRTISSRNYDVTVDAIETGKEFTIMAVDEPGQCYELKIGRQELSFMPEDEDLILVTTKEADAQDDKLLKQIGKMEKKAKMIKADSEAAALRRTLFPQVPADFPVKPLLPGEKAEDKTTCLTCGLSWDDAIVTSMTPAPGARCPFEEFHAFGIYKDDPIRRDDTKPPVKALQDAARKAETMFRNFAGTDPGACLTAGSEHAEACEMADELRDANAQIDNWREFINNCARPGDVANVIMERDNLRTQRDELLEACKAALGMFNDSMFIWGKDDDKKVCHMTRALARAIAKAGARS